MSNTLDWLRSYSIVVADTADRTAIATYQPIDATTNPSLVLKAVRDPGASALLADLQSKLRSGALCSVGDAAEYMSVRLGSEIASLIPGYISTEVDARLSFDTEASIRAAQRLMQRYADLNIPSERILIKLAATWEGIEAARALEAQGIHCNLTLVFSEAQAIAAAHAHATLISPFVGRIYDWYVARGEMPTDAEQDPGVRSVRRIFELYKSHGIKTIIMGASFRTVDQVLALAGCDRLTIAPALLEHLQTMHQPVHPLTTPTHCDTALPPMNRNAFLLAMAADPMATEKLADGITRFVADQEALEILLKG